MPATKTEELRLLSNDDLVARLHDREGLDRAAQASQEGRMRFTFDAHVDRLVAVLQRAAGRAGARRG